MGIKTVMRRLIIALVLFLLASACACAAEYADDTGVGETLTSADFIGHWESSFDGDHMELVLNADGKGYALMTPSDALSVVDIKYSYKDGVLTLISYPVGDSVNFIERIDYEAYLEDGCMYLRPAGSASSYYRFTAKQ